MDCDGKGCGSDGCGGVCGLCGTDEECVQGVCVADPGEEVKDPTEPKEEEPRVPPRVADAGLIVKKLSPGWGYDDRATEVAVAGEGFHPDAKVFLGGTPLVGVTVESSELIRALVPANLLPGFYMLSVVNPDGVTDYLDAAFEVRTDAEESSVGAGCTVGVRTQSTPIALLIGVLIAVLLLRTRSRDPIN